MKKKALYIITCLTMGLIWLDIMCVDAQDVAQQVKEVGVNPEKAVICAVFAAVAGICIFAFRHRKRIR